MRQIANYIVEDEPIARGGMGRIYRGRDPQGHIVAIKEILPEFATDWSIINRIEMEVKFLVRIDHPSIVKLYSAFRDEQTQCYYIVMELVEGMNIEQYVMKNGPMPEQQAVEMMLKILDALQCVHNEHIVHRDIKPSNIMIRPNGDICLLDFGIAKDLDSNGNNTVPGSVLGTNGYMSPEQAAGYSINYRSDIYAVGCVFFYMLTGHHAFNVLSNEFETKDNIIKSEFPRLSKYKKGLSNVLQEILDRATAKNMMQRYQSCYEFMSALSNGTNIGHTTSSNMPVKISVGREMCDIIINDSARKISRHHADIELKLFTGGTYYIFTDCSSNGTIVNGKLVKRTTINIPASAPPPEIYLAGVIEGHLDWKKVDEELRKRAHAQQETEKTEEAEETDSSVITVVKNKEEEKPGSQEVKPVKNTQGEAAPKYIEKDATGLLIASYIFAILGGLLGIIFGCAVAMGKVEMFNGDKVYKYKLQHRKLGWGAVALSVVSIIVWNVISLLMN